MRAAIVLLGVVLGGASTERSPSAPSPALAPPAQAPPLIGVVSATRALDLLPQVEGRLEQLHVRLGERVEAGQLVARLDTRTRQLVLGSRQAQLKATEVEHSRCALLLQQARQQLARLQRIRDYTAAEEVEKAETAVALASTDVELAQARVASARADVALAEEELAQAHLRAPFTGTVSEEYLQPGMLAGRATPIVRLVGEERMLRFAVPESLAGTLRRGHPLRIRVGDGRVLEGTVERVSPELDTVSRHVKAEARLNVPPEARAGLPVGTVVPVELGVPPIGTPP